jgi:hypothetical protein
MQFHVEVTYNHVPIHNTDIVSNGLPHKFDPAIQAIMKIAQGILKEYNYPDYRTTIHVEVTSIDRITFEFKRDLPQLIQFDSDDDDCRQVN